MASIPKIILLPVTVEKILHAVASGNGNPQSNPTKKTIMNEQLHSVVSGSNYGSIPEEEPSTTAKATDQEALRLQSHKWTLAAGILYAIIIVCGIFSEVGIRGNLIDYNDTDSTIANIQDSPASLRWSLLLDLTMSVSDVALSMLLGAALWVNGADKLLTMTSMAFRIVQQAILATNLLHLCVASLLLDATLPAAAVLSLAFKHGYDGDGDHLPESVAMLFLYLHKYGYAVALVFFGISMMLLGGVIWCSRIFPRWLGAASGLAGLGYLLDSTAYFWVKGYTGDGTMNNICMLPVFVAEFGLTGWLLLKKPAPAC